MFGCVSANQFAKLRSVRHMVMLRVIGFHRQLRTDHTTFSCAKVPKKARCEIIETTIRKHCLFAAGDVARQKEGRLPGRMMFATMIDGEGPKQGGQ